MSTEVFDAPHHDGSPLYLDDPAPDLGGRVAVRLRVPAAVGATEVHIRRVADGEPQYTTAEVLRREPGDDGAVWWQGEVPMTNPVTHYRFLVLTPEHSLWVNGRGTYEHDVPDRDDFVVSVYGAPPAWLENTVMYQIFPDRFARSAASVEAPPVPVDEWAIESDWDEPIADDWHRSVFQLYRGDLPGVVEKLDHLVSLGINLIYLTPVFPGRSAHRYDASTFDHVDPVLGGDEALAALVDAAHQRGIRVIGDLTTNHSGAHHRWFERAQADESSPEASYYTFHDHPEDYVAWYDVPSLPKFDLRSPGLRERLVAGRESIVGMWITGEHGLDGWRIDVANMTGRQGDIDVNHDVFRDVRATMAEVRPEAYLVAEHNYDATGDLAGDTWHGVMAYSWFTRPVWEWLARPDAKLMGVPGPLPRLTGGGMVAAQRALTSGVPWKAVAASMTLLDSHDTPRFASVAESPAHHRVAAGLLLTMAGVPMVYAGDEVGVDGITSDHGRRPFPWDEAEWDQELLSTFRELIGLRRSVDALGRGGQRYLAAGDDVIVFVRETADEQVLVLAARGEHDAVILDAAAVGSHRSIERLYGDGTATFADGSFTLTSPSAPAVTIWRLHNG